jgi:hypothetical protein
MEPLFDRSSPERRAIFCRAMHACALTVYRQRWQQAFDMAHRLANNVSLTPDDPVFAASGIRGDAMIEDVPIEVTVLAPLAGVDNSLLFAITITGGQHGFELTGALYTALSATRGAQLCAWGGDREKLWKWIERAAATV